MASIVLNKPVIVKTLETFGSIDNVEILDVIAGGFAKIKFKTVSTYTMIVPITWLFTKTSDGTEGVFAKGKIVSANIQLDEVLSRRGVITEIGESFVVAQFGERTRLIPFSRVKDISATTESLSGVPALAAPAVKIAKVSKPVAAPVAPVAPAVKAGKKK